ncbi:Os05g0121400, partial [Oryza sativa Japonica Group]
SIGSQRTPKCEKALSGLVPGWGDPSGKLLQECLFHALLQTIYDCVKHWIPKNSKMREGFEWTSIRMGRLS